MTTVMLQCVDCANHHRIEQNPESKDDAVALFGTRVCDAFPEGIPQYVERATKDCPKFKGK